MSGWTKQKGYPIISVQCKHDPDRSCKVLSLESRKFWTDAKLNEKGSFSHLKWRVPVTICKGSDPSAVCLEELIDDYDSATLEIVVPDVSPQEWVKVNAGISGFYRVSYESETLAEFLPAIREHKMPALDRQGILDDLFANVLAGSAPTVDILCLLEAFVADDNYAVWMAIVDILDKLLTLMDYTEYFEQFKQYGRTLLKKISKSLGWERKEGEDHLNTILRPCILRQMIALDDEETVAQAKKMFQSFLHGDQIIQADLRRVIYEGVLSAKGALDEAHDELFEEMMRLYSNSDLLEEKLRLLRSFGVVRNKEILERILNFSVSDKVRAQDSVTVITSVASTKEGREMAWKFFQQNWDLYRSRFEGGFIISSLVQSFENFITDEKASEIESFFWIHPFRGTSRVVQQVVENIRINQTWLERNNESLYAYFNNETEANNSSVDRSCISSK
jgi:puromycin-sensitive aminopeptidase